MIESWECMWDNCNDSKPHHHWMGKVVYRDDRPHVRLAVEELEGWIAQAHADGREYGRNQGMDLDGGREQDEHDRLYADGFIGTVIDNRPKPSKWGPVFTHDDECRCCDCCRRRGEAELAL